jgi:hypothetical protein
MSEKVANWRWMVSFVNDFRRNPSKKKLKEFDFGDTEINALYAGIVEMLAQEQGIKSPKWVLKKKYFLSNPLFIGVLKGEAKIYSLVESPVFFKRRNIFLCANTFVRV